MARKSAQSDDEFAGFDEVRPIGGGSFADVYRARDASTNQEVALKVLHATVKELGNNSTFDLETKALGTLSAHPNIVTLYRTTVMRSGRPMLVLELCARSLADEIRESGPLHPRLVARIGIQIAGALESAHRSGILHRDIKPQNILLSRYGVALLADFGVADMKNASGHEYAVSGLSVLHAPPEILWDKDASPRSDVYALASTLYELLCGRSPFFITDSENAAAVRLRVLNQNPPALAVRDMPAKMWDILNRALAKEPAQRHASALDFAQDLRALERLEGWPETECIVDGLQNLEPPDPTRLKTRLTGSVVNSAPLPGLGELGRGFGSAPAPHPVDDIVTAPEPTTRFVASEAPVITTTASPVAPPPADEPVPDSVPESVPESSPAAAVSVTEHDAPTETPSRPDTPRATDQPLLGLFSSLSGDTHTSSPDVSTPVAAPSTVEPEPPIEPALPRTEELPIVPTFDLQPAIAPATASSTTRDSTDPIPVPEPVRDDSGPIAPPPDDPSAVPGEVLWGYTPRTGLTGTIELNPKDRLSGSRPSENDDDGDKKSRLGRRRKKRD